MKLKTFLDRYDTVLFDMDGVITSEQGYWMAAALTVWEVFCENRGEAIVVSQVQKDARDIRDMVFCNMETVRRIKELGVNTNWDLAYLVLCVAEYFYNKDKDATIQNIFKKTDKYFHETNIRPPKLNQQITDLYCSDGLHGQDLWNYMQDVFQQWYLGDELYKLRYNRAIGNPGKTGLIHQEEPIVERGKIELVLKLLKQSGKRLGIGTGRPRIEIDTPLSEWGLYNYFDEDAFITYTEIENAQAALSSYGYKEALAKPHPFMFVKGMLGKDFSNYDIVMKNYDTSLVEKTLVVGDAGSDILAAKAMGADFAAVLTGVGGKNARNYFQKLKAEYILDSILDFIE